MRYFLPFIFFHVHRFFTNRSYRTSAVAPSPLQTMHSNGTARSWVVFDGPADVPNRSPDSTVASIRGRMRPIRKPNTFSDLLPPQPNQIIKLPSTKKLSLRLFVNPNRCHVETRFWSSRVSMLRQLLSRLFADRWRLPPRWMEPLDGLLGGGGGRLCLGTGGTRDLGIQTTEGRASRAVQHIHRNTCIRNLAKLPLPFLRTFFLFGTFQQKGPFLRFKDFYVFPWKNGAEGFWFCYFPSPGLLGIRLGEPRIPSSSGIRATTHGPSL